MGRPLLFIDFDGVINQFPAPKVMRRQGTTDWMRPDDPRRAAYAPDNWFRPDRRERLLVHDLGRRFTIRWNAELVARLDALDADKWWLSTWQPETAQLNRALGVDWPTVQWYDPTTREGIWTGKRRTILDALAQNRPIVDREHAILIASLLYAMDKIAKTCGHYDAYRKGAKFDKPLELRVPLAEVHNNAGNQCFNEDANELVKDIHADLIYIDPPYNSRQYSDAYHLLENVAHWEKPEVFGVARKMERKAIKSKYCTRSATETFEDLIGNINARYILLSYNNMATKGDGRSNAKIADEDIVRILRNKGELKIFSEDYKPFSAGKSSITGNAERLFLCTCNEG